MSEYNLPIAESIIRIFTGILFLFQGYDKLFRIGMPGVVNSFRNDAERNRISPGLVHFVAYFTSISEFICGMLLIVGLLTNYALYLLGLDLILVCMAFSFIQPMWDMKHVFPRLVLVILLLVIPSENRLLSLDHLLNLKKL
ncbi:MAG: DoxX family protein [Bacteroidetes bacterium]|nr:DoxX family protein [Bacteroidota bacterium]